MCTLHAGLPSPLQVPAASPPAPHDLALYFSSLHLNFQAPFASYPIAFHGPRGAQSALFLPHQLTFTPSCLSFTTDPGVGFKPTGFTPCSSPVKVTQRHGEPLSSARPGRDQGTSPPNPAAIAPVHLIFTTDRTFHGELDAHSTGNENFMTVLTRSCRLHQLRKHGRKRTTCEL